MSRATSPLWKHISSPDGDFRLAQCNQCGVIVQRGTENAPRRKCYNCNMQKHLRKYHGDLMEEVTNSQVAAKVANKEIDVRCELVQGVVPLCSIGALAVIAFYSTLLYSTTLFSK